MRKKATKLRGGNRVIGPLEMVTLDGKWNQTDIAKTGHRLYGITTMDIYVLYTKGSLDDSEEIPSNVCDRRFANRPEMLNFRHKQQLVLAKRLWCYRDSPKKMANLHKFLTWSYNKFIKKYNVLYKKTEKSLRYGRASFYLYSVITIAPSGHRCLWRITTKTKDEDGNPIRVAILAEIDGVDAVMYEFNDALDIAGNMAIDECKMTQRAVNSMVCELSPMAK